MGVITLLPAPRGIYPGHGRPIPIRGIRANGRPYIHPCANFDLYQAAAWKRTGRGGHGDLQRILDATADFHRRMYRAHRALDEDSATKCW